MNVSAPSGSRVLQMGIRKGSCVEAISPTGLYNVVTNDFTGGGGDGYTDLGAATVLLKTGSPLSDVVQQYITTFSPVSPSLDGRLVVLNGTTPYTPQPTCAPPPPASPPPPPPPTYTFNIAHYNDIHGRVRPSDSGFVDCTGSTGEAN